MDKNKIVEECKNLTRSVSRSLECPVCLEPPDIPVQCLNGHFICESCHTTIGNSCPTCKGHYSGQGNKCHAVQGIADMLKSLNISLDILDNAYGDGSNNLVTKYRDMCRTVLTRVSNIMTETHDVFVSLSEEESNNEKLKTITQHISEFKYFLEDVERDLTALKMQL